MAGAELLALQPEYDDRTEQAVLGSMLISADAVGRAIGAGLTRAHFYRIAHQYVFDAIRSLHEVGTPLDTVTVGCELRGAGRLEEVGGEAALMELFDSSPTPANVDHYVSTLARLHAKRLREVAAVEGLRRLRDGDEDEAAQLFQRAAQITARPSRLRAVPFADVSYDFSRGQLVKTWLSHGAFGVLHGKPNVGKSFLALDLALHVAMGWPWHGHRVQQGGVVYVASESPDSVRIRKCALWKHYGLDGCNVPLYLVDDPIDLAANDESARELERLIRDWSKDVPVRLVIIDTLASAMPGADENSLQGMGAAVSRVSELRARTGAAVLCVHHPTKGDNGEARGHGSLLGAADTEIRMVDVGQVQTATLTKSRDGATGAEIAVCRLDVHVGTGPDGESVFVPVLVPGQRPDVAVARPALEGQALDIHRVLVALQEDAPDGVPEIAWQTAWVRRESARGRKADSARKSFQRAACKLAGWVVRTGGLCRAALSGDGRTSIEPAPGGVPDNPDRVRTRPDSPFDRTRTGQPDTPPIGVSAVRPSEVPGPSGDSAGVELPRPAAGHPDVSGHRPEESGPVPALSADHREGAL